MSAFIVVIVVHLHALLFRGNDGMMNSGNFAVVTKMVSPAGAGFFQPSGCNTSYRGRKWNTPLNAHRVRDNIRAPDTWNRFWDGQDFMVLMGGALRENVQRTLSRE